MARSGISRAAREAADSPEYVAPLNDRQRRVAELVGRGASWAGAAREAGYASVDSAAAGLSKDPRALALVATERSKNEVAVEMSRSRVMAGLLEAVDIAKVQADATSMIRGWSEVARMCGYYAPDTKKIEVSVSAKRLVDKFETMSDAELLKYAEKDVIDVVAREIEAETSFEARFGQRVALENAGEA